MQNTCKKKQQQTSGEMDRVINKQTIEGKETGRGQAIKHKETREEETVDSSSDRRKSTQQINHKHRGNDRSKQNKTNKKQVNFRSRFLLHGPFAFFLFPLNVSLATLSRVCFFLSVYLSLFSHALSYTSLYITL